MKPIDFQGIVSLDQTLVDQLDVYLQEKETLVGRSILNAVHPLPRESLPPVLPVTSQEEIKLSDAVEAFSKNVQRVASSKKLIVAANDWEVAVRQINNALWEYVEVLEGCVTELFQRLGQVGFEQWHSGLMQAVDSVKELLNVRMEELTWIIRRLEALLWEFRWACEAKDGKNLFIKKLLVFWKSLLDRSLHTYLKRSRKFLRIKYKSFSQRYGEYAKLKVKIEQSQRKFRSYFVYKSLEKSHQQGFKKIYHLLKLWELNLKAKSLPQREPIRVLRSAYSIDKAKPIFNEYLFALKNTLFDRSRKFKSDPSEIYKDSASRKEAEEVIKGYRVEVHVLGATIGKFREFFLRTHPNPYVRTRWGFAEWIVGPEPLQTKELLNLVYEVETLDRLFEVLEESLQKGPASYDDVTLERQFREVQRTLHEMGQPLTARAIMRVRSDRLLNQLHEMNELGSFNPEVVGYMGKALSKAFRADWQHHVLFEVPLFHQLYSIHQGIVGPAEDRAHLNRLNTFKDLISQLNRWVKTRDTHRHVHEIETDITDMKGYLQDFFAHVQRTVKDDSLEDEKKAGGVADIEKQLLEYRYLFGKFFHFLDQHETEGKLIRNQFLFVDQYFESAENLIQDLRGGETSEV